MWTEHDLPWLAAPLAELQAHARGHALMLHGAAGSGQFQLAWRLARTWLCESPPGPCERCPGCHLSQARTHADLRVLMPETWQDAMGWHATDAASEAGEGGEVGESKSSAKRKPSREIKVDTVRAAIAWSHSSSTRGQGKVLVLWPAEAMNTVSANALLKTLEEPPAGVRLILCTRDPAQLLPTIRSRCQHFGLPPPPRGQAVDWLSRQGVTDAATLLDAAGGEVLDALALARAGLRGTAWNELPRMLAHGEAQALGDMNPAEVVRTLQKLCHDAMCRLAGASPRFFSPQSLQDLPQAATPQAWKALRTWQLELHHVARHDDHPWHAALLLDALVAQARVALSPIRESPRKFLRSSS